MSVSYDVMYLVPKEDYKRNYLKEESHNRDFILGNVEAKQLSHVEIGSAQNVEVIGDNCSSKRRSPKRNGSSKTSYSDITKPNSAHSQSNTGISGTQPSSSTSIGTQSLAAPTKNVGTQSNNSAVQSGLSTGQALKTSQSEGVQTVASTVHTGVQAGQGVSHAGVQVRPESSHVGSQVVPQGVSIDVQTQPIATQTIGAQIDPLATQVGVQATPERLHTGSQNLPLSSQVGVQVPLNTPLGTQHVPLSIPVGTVTKFTGSSHGESEETSGVHTQETGTQQNYWADQLVPPRYLLHGRTRPAFSDEPFNEELANREIRTSTPIPQDTSSEYFSAKDTSSSASSGQKSFTGNAQLSKERRMQALFEHMREVAKREMNRRRQKRFSTYSQHTNEGSFHKAQTGTTTSPGVSRVQNQSLSSLHGSKASASVSPDQTFTQPNPLSQVHFASRPSIQHSQSAPLYRCSHCGATFTRKDNLNRHLSRGKCSKRGRPKRSQSKGGLKATQARGIAGEIRQGTLRQTANLDQRSQNIGERHAQELASRKQFRRLVPSKRKANNASVMELTREALTPNQTVDFASISSASHYPNNSSMQQASSHNSSMQQDISSHNVSMQQGPSSLNASRTTTGQGPASLTLETRPSILYQQPSTSFFQHAPSTTASQHVVNRLATLRGKKRKNEEPHAKRKRMKKAGRAQQVPLALTYESRPAIEYRPSRGKKRKRKMSHGKSNKMKSGERVQQRPLALTYESRPAIEYHRRGKKRKNTMPHGRSKKRKIEKRSKRRYSESDILNNSGGKKKNRNDSF